MSSNKVIFETVNYQQVPNLADRINDYLRRTEAIPVDTPYSSSYFHISCLVDADWVYHLNDTTLTIETLPIPPKNLEIRIGIRIAGKYAKTISGDLQSILDQCK